MQVYTAQGHLEETFVALGETQGRTGGCKGFRVNLNISSMEFSSRFAYVYPEHSQAAMMPSRNVSHVIPCHKNKGSQCHHIIRRCEDKLICIHLRLLPRYVVFFNMESC